MGFYFIVLPVIRHYMKIICMLLKAVQICFCTCKGLLLIKCITDMAYENYVILMQNKHMLKHFNKTFIFIFSVYSVFFSRSILSKDKECQYKCSIVISHNNSRISNTLDDFWLH